MEIDPMQKRLPMHLSPRCGARTRSGKACQSGAMPNGRCRMHGGSSPGGARGRANGAYRDGRFTCDALLFKRLVGTLNRDGRRLAAEVV